MRKAWFPEVMRIAYLLVMAMLVAHHFFFFNHFVPFLPIAYYAITKEKEEDKYLQEIEEKFLQRKRNSPGVRYSCMLYLHLLNK